MKKTLFLSILFFSLLCCNAQVSYGDLSFGSYNIKINVSTENDSIFIIIAYTDAKNSLIDNPKLLLRLMDDTVISLDGKMLDKHSESGGGILVYGVYVASNYLISNAKFPVTKEQIEKIGLGIKKLRLNTSPKYHEKEWKRDKIGKTLYDSYLKASSNSFADGF